MVYNNVYSLILLYLGLMYKWAAKSAGYLTLAVELGQREWLRLVRSLGLWVAGHVNHAVEL